MTRNVRRLGLVVVLVLLGAAVVVFRPRGAAVAGDSSESAGRVTEGPVDAVVEDLELARLDAGAAARPVARRNPFRFGVPRAEVPERRTAQVTQAQSPSPGPAVPPPPPPIPLRFIGFVEEAGATPRIAVMSDGRGNVFDAKEGDIIEGRYRVLRVGTDSADLVYLDGRGRQTIRLSGQ